MWILGGEIGQAVALGNRQAGDWEGGFRQSRFRVQLREVN